MALIIDEILKERKISRKEFTEMLGRPPSSAKYLINGNPTLKTLREMASVLNLRLGDLFDNEDWPKELPLTPGERKSIRINIDGQEVHFDDTIEIKKV